MTKQQLEVFEHENNNKAAVTVAVAENGSFSESPSLKMSSIPQQQQSQQPYYYFHAQKLQEENWKGLLPIQLSLHPSSLSSPTMPCPVFKLVPRQSFLHIALKDEIQRLYAYAPSRMMIGSTNVGKHELKFVVEEPTTDSIGYPKKEIHELPQQEEDNMEDNKRENQNHDTSQDDSNNELAIESDMSAPITISSSPSESQEEGHAAESLVQSPTNIDICTTQPMSQNMDTNTNEHKSPPLSQQQQPHQRAVIPHCWFIDQETNTPLRWHIFIGILYDRIMGCHHQDMHEWTLPWKVQVSFTSYPTDILLPLPSSSSSLQEHYNSPCTQSMTPTICVITKAIQQLFTNTLKQALYLQYNTNRIALSSMTKQMHQQLWSSILRNKYELYRPIQEQVMNPMKSISMGGDDSSSSIHTNTYFRIPVGIFIDNQPIKVRPCLPLHKIKRENIHYCSNDHNRETSHPGTQQQEQQEEEMYVTLGQYLIVHLPTQYFQLQEVIDTDNDDRRSSNYLACTIIEKNRTWTPLFTWMIQGIQNISFTLPMVELWKALCHPDHFLYIIIMLKS